MAFSLAPFLGDGSELNPFRPGVDGPYAVIDLRADSTQAAGWCLLTADTVPDGAVDLGPGLEDRIPRGVSRNLENHLGVTLDQTDNLRAVIAELLILHGEDLPRGVRSRWRPLKADHRGLHRIVLGEPVYEAPAPQGAVITETWNTADQDSPSVDQTWTEVSVSGAGVDWDVVSNRIQRQDVDGNGHTGVRLEADLDSDDHYAEAEAFQSSFSSTNTWMVNVRWSPTAVDLYTLWARQGSGGELFLFKYVAGSRSTIVNNSSNNPGFSGGIADGDLVRLEADGSNLEGLFDGVSVISGTDTDITGNLRAGVGGRQPGIEWDNFEAGDLTAFDPANLDASVTNDDVTLTWDASF